MKFAKNLSILVCCLTIAGLWTGCSGDDTASLGGDADGGALEGEALGPTGDGDEDGSNTGTGTGTGDGSGTNGTGSGTGGGQAVPGGFIPMFPGAGTSGDDAPLMNGMLCDQVDGDPMPTAGDVTRCFFGSADPVNPAATIEQVLECVEGVNVLHLRLTFDPNFVDNTYGTTAIGWDDGKKGHTFKSLQGSDHAEIVIIDGDGAIAMDFKVDYITEDDSAPSGNSSLGVEGGDGEVLIGDPAHIIDATTSLDRNLNERGYSDYLENSPETDANYTPNPDAPEWDFRMVYEVWIDLEAFGDAGFSGAFIDFVHASPAKDKENTIDVVPGECPPDWDPGCDNPDGCDPCEDGDPDTECSDGNPPDPIDPSDPCEDGDPDTFCDLGSPPDPNADPAYCDQYPTDPACQLD